MPDFRAYGRARDEHVLPAGTYWIPLAQARKHWVQSMLNEDTYIPHDVTYDVTGWSNPLLMNVPGGFTASDLDPVGVPVDPLAEPAWPFDASGAPSVAVFEGPGATALESRGAVRWLFSEVWDLPFDTVTAARHRGRSARRPRRPRDARRLPELCPPGARRQGEEGARRVGQRRRAADRLGRQRRGRHADRRLHRRVPDGAHEHARQPRPDRAGRDESARRRRRPVRVGDVRGRPRDGAGAASRPPPSRTSRARTSSCPVSTAAPSSWAGRRRSPTKRSGRAGHVIVTSRSARSAPQRVVGDVRSTHAPLDAAGLDDVPDRLSSRRGRREPDEIEAGSSAHAPSQSMLPVRVPSSPARPRGCRFACTSPSAEPRRVGRRDGLRRRAQPRGVDPRAHAARASPPFRPTCVARRMPWSQVQCRQRTGDTSHGGDALDHLLHRRL